MRKIFSHRYTVLSLGFLGILALGALAAGMRHITFRPPVPFNLRMWMEETFGQSAIPVLAGESPNWQVWVFWGIILYLTVLVIMFMNKELRKQLAKLLKQVITFMILMYFATRVSSSGLLPSTAGTADAVNNANLRQEYPQAVFTPPENNMTVNYLISAAIMLGLVALGWWLYVRARNRQEPSALRAELAGIARKAASDLAEGRDWDDTIIRCYLRMTDTVSAARGLSRGAAVTPAEFAHHLQRAGLPAEPVVRLTSMFEAVRYGGKSTSISEQQEAIFCLNAIVSACEEQA